LTVSSKANRFLFSPRIRMLKEIRDKLRPPPVREALPPPRVYAAIAGNRRPETAPRMT
jgi:hypothetical protein